MKIKKSDIIVTLIGILIILGLIFTIAYPVIKALSVCEQKEWDGSEHNTGVRNLDIGEDFGKDIIMKCNKAPKETDAMVDVLDALPGINIKDDIKEVDNE